MQIKFAIFLQGLGCQNWCFYLERRPWQRENSRPSVCLLVCFKTFSWIISNIFIFRIISDKYIVSVNDHGELKQWDLHTVLDHAVPADQALLHSIGSSKNLSTCVGGGMVADEYQVVLFGFFRTAPIKGQKEFPIIVSLDFMKGQNRVKRPLPQLYWASTPYRILFYFVTHLSTLSNRRLSLSTFFFLFNFSFFNIS